MKIPKRYLVLLVLVITISMILIYSINKTPSNDIKLEIKARYENKTSIIELNWASYASKDSKQYIKDLEVMEANPERFCYVMISFNVENKIAKIIKKQ